MKQDGTTLVIGGTGKTGRRVVERLQRLGLPYRIGSCSAQPAFDWEDRQSWSRALVGVDRAYVTFYPDICVPGGLEKVESFFKFAVDAGVKRLVFLSGRGEAEAEQALKKSGADWTILRSSFFCQNFSEGFLLEPILAGEVALAVPVGEPFVDADDIADVADAVTEIAQVTGREIRFLSISPEQYRAAMLEAQVPSEVIDLVLYLFGTVLDGRNTPVAYGVQEASIALRMTSGIT